MQAPSISGGQADGRLIRYLTSYSHYTAKFAVCQDPRQRVVHFREDLRLVVKRVST